MWQKRNFIALLLLMVTALLQTAQAHSLVHDDDHSDPCSICFVIQQAQPVLQTPAQTVVFEYHKHAIYVAPVMFDYSAFAKAEQSPATLSIRPPPHS
jgi:hypothetical protein